MFTGTCPGTLYLPEAALDDADFVQVHCYRAEAFRTPTHFLPRPVPTLKTCQGYDRACRLLLNSVKEASYSGTSVPNTKRARTSSILYISTY